MSSPKTQSSYYPPKTQALSREDWMLYLKVRSVKKVELVRQLNIKINQVLQQNLNVAG